MASELVGGLAYPWSIVEKQNGLDQRGKEAASGGVGFTRHQSGSTFCMIDF